MKKALSFISLLLALIMVLSAFAACTLGDGETDDTRAETVDADSQTTGAETSSDTEPGEQDEETEDTTPLLEGNDAELIELANRLANGVQSYYQDVDRSNYVIENKNSILNYQTWSSAPQLVTSLTTKSGKKYIENTMDVFVRMQDGKTYYASDSLVGNGTNIYRLGYYYYETRLEDQIFVGADGMEAPMDIEHMHKNALTLKDVKIIQTNENSNVFEITNRKDPSVVFERARFSTEKYQYIEIVMRASGVGANGELFVKAGGSDTFNDKQRIEFSVSGDGQFHTYTIPLETVENYTGSVRGIRLDINGAPGATFEIASVRALGMDPDAPGNLYLNRSFLTYSDKMHQIIQIAATQKTKNVAAVGMLTKIDASTVEGVVIKDRQGLHYDVGAKIAWNTVQYVGFMIKDTGVFGYMLPYDGKGGNLRVTLEDGYYVIEQRATPEDWTISPSADGTDNADDFYMGQRIYTDTEKTFDKFIHEAECEVNPLGEDNFLVNPLKSGGARFIGYDSLHGYYRFDVDAASGFQGPYVQYPNRHFGVQFTVKGDDKDRQLYVMTYGNQGSLECAVVLNDKSMLIPIPVEVAKNFKGDGENTIFMKDDSQYGETFIPLIVKANSTDKFSILTLYQNWGNFPLKQISSIQYFGPYYHLSVGTTETNCLVPYGSGGLSLPDFRTMSAPIWSEINPQHNSCGSHSFVRYTDSDGNFISNQINGAVIDSYGPTYADMSISFITDDGKMKITYNHMEQPHTDENRSYFTLKLEVLSDITINNFKEDFYFYSVSPNDPTGVYQRVGYLDSNNQSCVVAANKSGTPVEYTLGSLAPYFSFYDMDGYSAAFNKDANAVDGKGYANVAMIIGSSEFIIGGEEVTADFVLRDVTKTLRLSLDLAETKLVAGDSLTINGILMPWGSQEMEGTYDEHEDQNVRNVREDSFLKPLKATAVENCVAERKSVGVFLPELVSTNGKSATFTLSGGANNNAVRIYGFTQLTVPVVEELVDGQWQVYELASINNRDRLGYGHSYDGYNVFYDGDGTFSYSFVANMDKGDRTFRITVDGEFEGWGDEKDPTEDLPMNFYITPDNMADLGATLGTLYGCTSEFVEADGERFFRFYGTNHAEGYLIPYNESPLYPTTGQYFVFKYRLPVENKVNISYFDVFTSTTAKWFTADGVHLRASGVIKKDGEWHTIVIDLSTIPTYKPNEAGEYLAKFLRVDVLNSDGSKIPETDYIDVAYFGFSDDLQKILDISGEESYISLYQNGAPKKVDTKSGEITEDKDPINYYYDPVEMGTLSTKGCSSLLSADKSYRQYFATGANEGELFVFSGNGSKVTGQYLVVKYRVPEGVNMANNFEIFASTVNASPAAGKSTSTSIIKDGNWHVLIVDLSKISEFDAVDGVYKAKHVRLDVINGKFTHTEEAPAYIDIEYFGLHDSLEGIFAINEDADFVTVVNNTGFSEKYHNTDNGFVAESEMGDDGGLRVELTPDSFPKPSGCTLEVAEDGSYGRFYASGAGEAHISVYKNPSQKTTGKYFYVKFRIPTGANMPTNFQIYSSTQNGAAGDNGGKDNILVGSILPGDDWQLLVVDLSQISTFTKINEKYAARYLRFDLINGKHTHTDDVPAYIDIAVVGINDSLVQILEANSDIAIVQFADSNGKQTKLTNDGTVEEPVEKVVVELTDPINVFQYPYEIESLRVRGLTKTTVNDGSYITINATGSNEGSVFAYENSAGSKVTGQYFVFKYRVPADSAAMPGDIEIFASTKNAGETEGDNIQIGNFISDGEWHVMVIDLSLIATFNDNGGEYFAKYVRLDIVNGKRDSSAWIDVAYFGLHDDLEEIYALNADMGQVYLVSELDSGKGKGTNVVIEQQ